MILVGNDWAEGHHDVYVMDEEGTQLSYARLPEGLAGVARFHEMVAEYASDPAEVVVGIETDRGLWVAAVVGAGYQVYAINPLAVSRYRDRHSLGGAKSDRGDAKVLADLVRTDRHNHRRVAGDSPQAEGIKIMAPHTPEPDLGAGSAYQPATKRAPRVLPGSPRNVRGPGPSRRCSRLGPGTHTKYRRPPDAAPDPGCAEKRRTATQRRQGSPPHTARPPKHPPRRS